MRLLFRRVRYQGIDHDLDLIRSILCSSSFVFIDIFFWSLTLAIFTFAIHQSIAISSLTFIGSYTSSFFLFMLLKKWLRDQPD
ncbi:hypothetical protein P2R12_00560 [Cytobacillus oceanisediminis]|uniref:hypothetical protein n=1 Tax=Cytobacillus oceanisediminis TaxID=665099 RepID=UPI0023DCCEBA|nr:hypothetical protein [Cytobacillus oceanisediminis]MDF2035472.1 hypothetical protein [Cytobacillus oceanisediminis]